MIKKKKILFFVYCLLVSALSIGWYPQNQNKQVKKDITLVRKSSEKMAALVENNQFCYQGVTETDMDERRMNTQEDEKQRRTVKTIVRYRVNLEHGARRILERIVEAESGDQTIKGRQMVANVILNITRIGKILMSWHRCSERSCGLSANMYGRVVYCYIVRVPLQEKKTMITFHGSRRHFRLCRFR